MPAVGKQARRRREPGDEEEVWMYTQRAYIYIHIRKRVEEGESR